MRYRRFGRTDLQMPVFSCGGMRFQHQWEDVKPEDVPNEGQRNLEATIHRALELGINHIETARGYGSSEMQLGWVLPQLPREKLIVQTKIAPFGTPEEFREKFEASLRYLQLEHVDLLSLHGVNNAELLEWTLRKGGCLEAAQQLQREGRCRFIGFSTHAKNSVILRAIESDAFDYVNLHWYFVNDTHWPAVEAATARDMGVFIISPSDKGGMLYAPSQKLRDLCTPLTPMQFNDLYCLARPEVHTLSIGAACPSDFDEHVAALDSYERASEMVAPIEQRLMQALEETHGRAWMAARSHPLPEFDEVPGEINLQDIVRLWHFAKALDLTEWAKVRYNLLGNGGHWFPGKNAQEMNREAVQASLNGHPFAGKIVAILEEAHALYHGEAKQRLSKSGN